MGLLGAQRMSLQGIPQVSSPVARAGGVGTVYAPVQVLCCFGVEGLVQSGPARCEDGGSGEIPGSVAVQPLPRWRGSKIGVRDECSVLWDDDDLRVIRSGVLRIRLFLP